MIVVKLKSKVIISSEKFVTIMSETNSVEAQSTIIAALCAEAPSDVVRDCLRKYDPKKPAWHIENAFKTEKKAVLVETLDYLGVPGMGLFKVSALPHELLCRVQNLFPDECDLCKGKYCVRLRDKPIVSCVRCGQGCHNECILQLLGKTEEDLNDENDYGASILNPNAAVGLFYLSVHVNQR